MGRIKNDGRGRLGGRAKGTPNKTTGTIKVWLTDLLTKNKKQIVEDLQQVAPQERLRFFTGLLQYIVPKQQSISVEDEYAALSRLLQSAPEEAIEQISEKVIAMEGRRDGRECA